MPTFDPSDPMGQLRAFLEAAGADAAGAAELVAAVAGLLSGPNPPGVKKMLAELKKKNLLWGGLDSKQLRAARGAATALLVSKAEVRDGFNKSWCSKTRAVVYTKA